MKRERLSGYVNVSRVEIPNYGLWLDKKGNVYSSDGTEAKCVRKVNGRNKSVFLKSDNGRVEVAIAKVMVWAWKKLFAFSLEEVRKIRPLFIDGDRNNLHPGNLTYGFTKPLPLRKNPNYFRIPGCTKYGLSKEGLLLNGATGKTHSFSIHGRYMKASILDDLGRHLLLGRGRAKLLAFKDYPANVDVLECDHKDTDGFNDGLSNLQWLTQSKNAGKEKNISRKGKGRRVCVFDVRENTQEIYSSSTVAAKATGMHFNSVDRLSRRAAEEAVYQLNEKGTYAFSYEDSGLPVPVASELEKQVGRSGMCASCMVKSYRPESFGEVKIFESSGAAARYIGTVESNVSRMKSTFDDVPCRGYVVRPVLDKPEWPDFTEAEGAILKDASRISAIVTVEDPLTKEIYVGTSIQQVAKQIGIAESTIRNAEKKNVPLLGRFNINIKRLRSWKSKSK
ncbi:hypothetical protein [Vibrio phage vB_VmeM-Yong XC32]|nr:hypothetical protein [Vibrio phage vB_VmeM-Yong XC31]QAX96376.1 hypothetical protein [Vibrio phage vB_VmeM-Yong XC32]QAX96694.1 hypothetical protein [Vibrio phage vB_VmeM-Yong MS31]QAX97012.1 hypothetical protein [Vibrio phage vB_VmeM-Yong MS32]